MNNALKYCPLYEIISLILFDWFFVGIRATFPYFTRNPRQYTLKAFSEVLEKIAGAFQKCPEPLVPK